MYNSGSDCFKSSIASTIDWYCLLSWSRWRVTFLRLYKFHALTIDLCLIKSSLDNLMILGCFLEADKADNWPMTLWVEGLTSPFDLKRTNVRKRGDTTDLIDCEDNMLKTRHSTGVQCRSECTSCRL